MFDGMPSNLPMYAREACRWVMNLDNTNETFRSAVVIVYQLILIKIWWCHNVLLMSSESKLKSNVLTK